MAGSNGNVQRGAPIENDITEHAGGRHSIERLLELEQRARADAEAARDRTARLQALTAALSTAATADEVARAVVTQVTAAFGAAGTVIACRAPDGAHLELLLAADMPDDIRDEWHRFPIETPAPLADVAREGTPIFLESRQDWSARYPHLLPTLDATEHHANAVAPLVVDGRVIGVLGAAFSAPRVFDVEDRAQVTAVAQLCAQALERARLFEAERSARREAEAASRAKSEFLAVMSHELRTPLNAIGGYTQLIELGVHGPVTDAQRMALARIQVSQRHLLGLIAGVLDYARVEAGAVTYRLMDVPVTEVVGEAEALVAPQLRAKGLGYSWSGAPLTPSGRPLSVRADREKVQQILLNLLGNAIKFTDARDGIPGRVEVTCTVDGSNRVQIQVRDTGSGIAADELERIFEPFVQVDQKLTRPNTGVGLGLAISRDLSRGMGGDLTAESQPGVGSRFTLVLPVAP